MIKLGKEVGNQMIRELGLAGFPKGYADYYLMDGGVIAALKSKFGGNEMHIAFNEKEKARGECERFCNHFGGVWWAIIRHEKISTINCAKKIGFKYSGKFKGLSVQDNKEREYVALKRG